MKKYKRSLFLPVLAFCLLASGCAMLEDAFGQSSQTDTSYTLSLDDIDLASFRSDQPWIEIDHNVPNFTESDLTTEPFETYAQLDPLGRCGVAYANICPELMPEEARGDISSVKPSGWQSVKYDSVDGKYLYNRCHLIGYQLAGENANELNLITGTRYLNIEGMLPFENLVADYVKETDNHVLYRVTPVFEGDNLVASGVQMEGYSVEDDGDGVCFNVFCYNAQPGIAIDYATGNSWEDSSVGTGSTAVVASEAPADVSEDQPEQESTYILNTNSKKFHLPDCSGAASISQQNKETYTGDRDILISQGYEPCGICKP